MCSQPDVWPSTRSELIASLSYVPESFLSSQSHEPFESESRQSHLKFCRVVSDSSHDLVESGQSRVTRMVESLRVIGLQARVNVESYKFQTFLIYFWL